MTRRKGDGDSGSGLFSVGPFRDKLPGRGRGKPSGGVGWPVAGHADGPGSLVRSGPGAAALDGKLPLFVVHRPYRFHESVPQLLKQLGEDARGKLALGVSSGLPRQTVRAHLKFNSACEASAIRIVDPQGYLADKAHLRVKTLSPRAGRRAPYLRGSDYPVVGILDLQRECGANLLLTAGRALDTSDALGALAAACDEGDQALAALRPGERLALNLTLNAQWLRNPLLRDNLLAELIENRQFAIWHIRVQWPAPARSWVQPVDEELLGGYRVLAETAREHERVLLLPQTGLTGWLALAWGVTGFGTGSYGSNQAFLEESDRRGGKVRSVERYFERQVLHTVERTALSQLAANSAYQKCTCPYCGSLLDGKPWLEEYAGLHHLYGVGMLAAEVAPAAAGRPWSRDVVAGRVREAAQFAAGKLLTGHSDPAHLRTWDRLL